jgi:hypothetical protein
MRGDEIRHGNNHDEHSDAVAQNARDTCLSDALENCRLTLALRSACLFMTRRREGILDTGGAKSEIRNDRVR